jgi:hypothetical protein
MPQQERPVMAVMERFLLLLAHQYNMLAAEVAVHT